MPRRANQGVQPAHLAVVALVAAVVGFGAWTLFGRAADPFAGITDLDVQTYYENGRSLAGNTYRVQGVVDEKLKWTPKNGQLINVMVDNGGSRDPLPIRVPEELGRQNIQTGQEFLFKVEVGRGGILTAREILKI